MRLSFFFSFLMFQLDTKQLFFPFSLRPVSEPATAGGVEGGDGAGRDFSFSFPGVSIPRPSLPHAPRTQKQPPASPRGVEAAPDPSPSHFQPAHQTRGELIPSGPGRIKLTLAFVPGCVCAGISRVRFFWVKMHLATPGSRALLAPANKPAARLACMHKDPRAIRYLQGRGLII